MKRLDTNWKDAELGFQIAPMIDVVFVIMLFFMVMAGAVKVEKELNSQLPGNAETSTATEFVDEQVINIAENGEVMLNEEPMDTPASRDLPTLKATLTRIKERRTDCLTTRWPLAFQMRAVPKAALESRIRALTEVEIAELELATDEALGRVEPQVGGTTGR